MSESNFPFIVVELFLVAGGALAFGAWQLWDLKKERLKRENVEKSSSEGAGS
jgi:hypothetical protein